MKEAVIESLKLRFKSCDDIVAMSDDKTLVDKLDVARHKSLAEHLWCVIGARESYAKAIAEGAWSGFNCSVQDYSKAAFVEKARSSANEVTAAIDSVQDWTADREGFLLALAEHEVMHEGQIIRHLYAFEREIPETVKWA